MRNVGQFDSVDAGAQIPLTKLTLVYAENGRGKTTLAAILRSLGLGDSSPISERRRLGAAHPPNIVLNADGTSFVFQQDAWSAPLSAVSVFDDIFVAENVCSGVEIQKGHRQNLHELILGARGVALNVTLQTQIDRVEEHNRTLKTKAAAIPTASRGELTVDAFCALEPDNDIDAAIHNAERALAAARAAEAVQQEPTIAAFELPSFDIETIHVVLQRALPELEVETAAHVQAHLAGLGEHGEAWVGDGIQRIAEISAGKDGKICPFCAQGLRASPIIGDYQAYFSTGYANLKAAIVDQMSAIAATHAGDVPAAFERAVRIAIQSSEFWSAFTDVPTIDIDTAAIARAWKAAREAVMTALRAKQAAPLDARTLSPAALDAIASYDAYRAKVAAISEQLQTCNTEIALVKEQAATANIAALIADLAKKRVVEARHSVPITPLCQGYLDEKESKSATETLRDQARDALDQYRRNVFPAYEIAINDYLRKFNAGFRLGSVSSTNTRVGSSCTYHVLINEIPVALNADVGPSFRNTMSAGDRNTLALAFFFASLERDPQLVDKVVVVDDPMTSLDEHRSLTTVQEMRRLLNRVGQLIVLSHSKPFLCALWKGADTMTRSAIRIARDGTGSTLAIWDVHQDCITEHDRCHALVTEYALSDNPANGRVVAAALRSILEAFMRVAYPADFPPGTLLGKFIDLCQQRLGAPSQILACDDIAELRDLLDYANRFHHNTNAACETEAINDQELWDFCDRTLSFTRRNI